MYERIETASGQVVIVRAEPDGSISILVGRSGVYVLASLTLDEIANVRAALTLALRSIGKSSPSRTLGQDVSSPGAQG